MLIVLLLIWNVAEARSVYRIFQRKHLLFDDRYTMSMCMAATMTASFTLSLHVELLLSAGQRYIYLLPVLLGAFIGWKFGTLVKAPASINGLYNGVMGGIMGMMLGAVLKNPALCKIPLDSAAAVATNMYSLALFTTCLHVLVSSLIRYSFRV